VFVARKTRVVLGDPGHNINVPFDAAVKRVNKRRPI
jgi:hypothetical protein